MNNIHINLENKTVDTNSTININNLTMSFGNTKALNGINLEIPNQGIVGLIGRNGSGKTTLLKELCGQLKPTDGNIFIYGENPVDNLKVLNKIVYLYHNYNYASGLRLKDILKQFQIMYEHFDLEFANKLLSFFELLQKQKYQELSQGMASIFNFICALSCRADITLLDEPVLAMDVTVRKNVYEILLREYSEHPRLFIISSHLLSELEGIMTDVILLDSGKVILNSEIETLQQYVYKVNGDENLIENYVKDKNVIYRKKGTINSFAIINEAICDELEKKIKQAGLNAVAVTVEDIFVYLTKDDKDEQMDALWNEE